MQVSRATFEMVKEQDNDPDLSYLGEYKNQPSDKAHTVDRQKRGDMNSNREYRYFIATNSAEETGNRLSVGQDYKRSEAYNRGDWCMVYIRAKVTLNIPHGSGFIMQEIKSPGLFGIESDSDDSYFDEVFKDECGVLEEMLKAMGTIEIVD